MSTECRPKTQQYKMRTHLIHGNYQSTNWDFNHHIIPPMTASAAYRLGSVGRGAQGFVQFGSEEVEAAGEMPILIYDRLHEPTRGMLEENLAYAEQGETAVCFASGMAAVSAAVGINTKAGDQIVAHHTLYGCTYSLFTNWLPRFGIETKFADLRSEESFRAAINENTRVVYLETPVNPTMDLIDLQEVKRWVDDAKFARGSDNLVVVVDNTFATPFCQRPLTLGADMVVHSLTKNIGGFGTDMGGAVITAQRFYEPLMMYRKDFGGVLSPKNAWPILVYGLPTLASRLTNQQKSAMKIAEFLQSHPKVEKVLYPGLTSFPQHELARRQMVSYDGQFAPGSMLYFTIKAKNDHTVAAAQRFVNYIADNAYSITLAVSLGQIRTLIEDPYSMTHSALPDEVKTSQGLKPGSIRLSIGLEDWQDIVNDLNVALENV